MTTKSSLVALGAIALAASALTSAGTTAASPAQRLVATHSLSATLTPQAVVTVKGKHRALPAKLVHATGSFTATLSSDLRTLSWKLAFANLGRPLIVVGDIHAGRSAQWGPILLRLCTECRAHPAGVTKLKAADGRRLLTQASWITLITNTYPNGAIRGQIRVR